VSACLRGYARERDPHEQSRGHRDSREHSSTPLLAFPKAYWRADRDEKRCAYPSNDGETQHPGDYLYDDEHGEWTPAFPGQRPPVGAGKDAAATHGAYSERRIRPRAEEWLRRLDGTMRAARVHAGLDDVAREQLARSLARVDLLEQEIDERRGWFNEAGELTPAASFLFRQDRTILAQLRELGLTVKSRAEIGLVVAGAQDMIAQAEVAQVISAVVKAAVPLLPVERRGEYLAVTDQVAGSLGAGGGAAG
jgi:hypothetical protein